MFKHILLPTDGSAMSEQANRKCLKLARESGASVTAIYAIPEYHSYVDAPGVVIDSPEQYQNASLADTRRILGEVEALASEAGVPCDTRSVCSDHPHEVIIKAARALGCDLICMASHGHQGVKGVLLGSVTQKVLAHGDTPVLVYR
ncbi:MAG TPA: universal stress protein [Telluria sp.]|nr:universal stress protein [Telluria sp.]